MRPKVKPHPGVRSLLEEDLTSPSEARMEPSLDEVRVTTHQDARYECSEPPAAL